MDNFLSQQLEATRWVRKHVAPEHEMLFFFSTSMALGIKGNPCHRPSIWTATRDCVAIQVRRVKSFILKSSRPHFHLITQIEWIKIFKNLKCVLVGMPVKSLVPESRPRTRDPQRYCDAGISQGRILGIVTLRFCSSRVVRCPWNVRCVPNRMAIIWTPPFTFLINRPKDSN